MGSAGQCSFVPGRSGCHLKNIINNLDFLFGISMSNYDSALRGMPKDLTDGKSTSFQVMAWYRQALPLSKWCRSDNISTNHNDAAGHTSRGWFRNDITFLSVSFRRRSLGLLATFILRKLKPMKYKIDRKGKIDIMQTLYETFSGEHAMWIWRWIVCRF